MINVMQRVRPGVRVHATVQDPPKAPGSPLGKLLTTLHSVGESKNERPAGTSGR